MSGQKRQLEEIEKHFQTVRSMMDAYNGLSEGPEKKKLRTAILSMMVDSHELSPAQYVNVAPPPQVVFQHVAPPQGPPVLYQQMAPPAVFPQVAPQPVLQHVAPQQVAPPVALAPVQALNRNQTNKLLLILIIVLMFVIIGMFFYFVIITGSKEEANTCYKPINDSKTVNSSQLFKKRHMRSTNTSQSKKAQKSNKNDQEGMIFNLESWIPLMWMVGVWSVWVTLRAVIEGMDRVLKFAMAIGAFIILCLYVVTMMLFSYMFFQNFVYKSIESVEFFVWLVFVTVYMLVALCISLFVGNKLKGLMDQKFKLLSQSQFVF